MDIIIIIIGIGFSLLIGIVIGYQGLMSLLKQEGYIIFIHHEKKNGEGRYKIFDLTDYQKEQIKGEK